MKQLRHKIYKVIFDTDTKSGRTFDLSLLIVILISIALVMIESVPSMRKNSQSLLRILEWIITIIFSIEYVLRIWVVRHPLKYIFSFYGIIDLLSILPTYLGIFFSGGQSFIVIRALRLLRVFRILKISRYMKEGKFIMDALRASRAKISVFLFGVIMIVIVVGTIMYLVEGEKNGFTSIPRGIYWAIVTLTTVGYGDISPVTTFGQFIASFVMILGYAIIAVPTGIVSAEISRSTKNAKTGNCCPNCVNEDNDADAHFCKKCGASLPGSSL